MGPSQEKINALEKQMKTLNILKSDIQEKFIKCGGRGGQKVNKTNAGVYLLHIPTQLSVKCTKSRSQTLNRFLALRLLVEKIQAKTTGIPDKEAKRIARLKKQKLRRTRKSRQKHKGH